MSEPGEDPRHPPVEGPESPLEPVREQAHVDVAELQARVAALEARERTLTETLEARERELLDRLARLQADFENFRRRSREDAAQAAARGKEALLKQMLPVLDNLDRALAHAEDPGLRMIARQLAEVLAAQGVTVVDPAGEAFDAKLHEAVAEEEKEGAKPGAVVTVLEKGYLLDGRVLRPARVVVAK